MLAAVRVRFQPQEVRIPEAAQSSRRPAVGRRTTRGANNSGHPPGHSPTDCSRRRRVWDAGRLRRLRRAPRAGTRCPGEGHVRARPRPAVTGRDTVQRAVLSLPAIWRVPHHGRSRGIRAPATAPRPTAQCATQPLPVLRVERHRLDRQGRERGELLAVQRVRGSLESGPPARLEVPMTGPRHPRAAAILSIGVRPCARPSRENAC